MRPGPVPMPIPPPPPPAPRAEPPAPPVPPAPALGAAVGASVGAAVGSALGSATTTTSGALVTALRPRLSWTRGCGRVTSGAAAALTSPSGLPPGAPPGPRTRKTSPQITASAIARRFHGTRRASVVTRGAARSGAGRGSRAAMSARPSAARVSRATRVSRALSRAPGTRSLAAARAAARASPLRTDSCSAARRAARRSASRSLIKVDLQREGRSGIAGDELVVRLRHGAGELAVLQQLERERGDAVALRGALVRAVGEHDGGVTPRR